MNLFEKQHREFIQRHIGPDENEAAEMLQTIGAGSLDQLIEKTVPNSIRLKQPLSTGNPLNEYEYLSQLKEIASKNMVNNKQNLPSNKLSKSIIIYSVLINIIKIKRIIYIFIISFII